MGKKQVVLQSLANLWDGPLCKHTKWARLDLTEKPLLLSRWCDAICEIKGRFRLPTVLSALR